VDKQGNVAVQPPAETLFTEEQLVGYIDGLLK
jgi:hypothetical protein